MTILTGLLYPLFITGIAKVFFSEKAGGSMIKQNGIIMGSELIGQNFSEPQYFWPRPSATNYNAMPSGGSNLGPTSAELKKEIENRRKQLISANGGNENIPADLLFGSASGLDPDISPQAARYQIDRILAARDLDHSSKTLLLNLIDEHIERPDLGVLGEPRINVLKLNLALDSLLKVQK